MGLHHDPKKVHEELFGFGIQNVHMQDILMIIEKLTHMAYTQPPVKTETSAHLQISVAPNLKFPKIAYCKTDPLSTQYISLTAVVPADSTYSIARAMQGICWRCSGSVLSPGSI
jgi:hypothetical protein